jgi:hypothetical protein
VEISFQSIFMNEKVSLLVEKKIEKYVYNPVSVIGAIGGSLGLFLGYFVIGILLKAVQNSYSLANYGKNILEITISE